VITTEHIRQCTKTNTIISIYTAHKADISNMTIKRKRTRTATQLPHIRQKQKTINNNTNNNNNYYYTAQMMKFQRC